MPAEYCVEFKSKASDGKRAWLEKQWIEDLYMESQFSPGNRISLYPGQGMGGKMGWVMPLGSF